MFKFPPQYLNMSNQLFLLFGCVYVVGYVQMVKQIESDMTHGTCNVNLLTPNVNYSGRTAPLTSKVAFYIFIQQI